MKRTALLVVMGGLALIGCKAEDGSDAKYSDRDVDAADGDDGSEGDDGGTDGTDGADGGDCTAEVVETLPESGDNEVYTREILEVLFSEDVRTIEPSFSLMDSAGGAAAITVTYDETGMRAFVAPDEAMVADATYTLAVDVCASSAAVDFSTTYYGAPLELSDSELVGLTYAFDLGGANYTKPAGLGAVLGSFLSAPLLIGIGDLTDGNIQILGTQGLDGDSGPELDPSYPVWDFGSADFSTSPYFSSDPVDIELDYDGIPIPIYNFSLFGTFAPDGSSIGFAGASGSGDSRNMGPLIGAGSDPSAICDTAAGFGVSCEDCPNDGQPYCLEIELEFEPAPLAAGIDLFAEWSAE